MFDITFEIIIEVSRKLVLGKRHLFDLYPVMVRRMHGCLISHLKW